MRILTVNTGSSSVKLRLIGADDHVAGSVDLPAPGMDVDREALRHALGRLGPADAVGHRFVHGGVRFAAPVAVDAAVREELERLVPLAPLHQPKALAALAAVRELRPELPAVACFDTAFHAHLPPAAATYPLPESWRRLGIRRYGFHGLSHAYAARRTAALLGGGEARLVTCHLGAGASLAAVRDGRSVDTTMGFTPLEGLMMATRAGSVDPGAILWLQRRHGLGADAVEHALEHESGLVGLAGTADMRAVVTRAAAGDGAAALALDVYVHRLCAAVAAMAAALRGVDALVFTGGVGEHSAEVRRRAADGLGWLGVVLDAGANTGCIGDRELSASGARVRTFVVEAREDLELAAGVRQALGGRGPAGEPSAR